MLELDRRRVVIARKHLPSGICSLREDLGSGLVPDHGCDLEGLFKTLPSLNASKRQLKLHAHRQDLLCDRDAFSPSDVATSLAPLGMDPSTLAMKQIFEFLLGQVWGYRVPRQLQTIEQQLIIDQKSKTDEFDHTAHSLAVTTGKTKLLIYFQQRYALDVGQLQAASDPWGRKTPQELRREWRKSWAARINELFCLDFET
jgi:hypothetical protein